MSTQTGERRALDVAAGMAATLRAWAAGVDAESRFPSESMQALRASGLLGLVVPRRHGGWGEPWSTFVAVTQTLAAECLSTAMIWVMHCQQVAAIADHAAAPLQEAVLPAAARGELLLAGVTSESGSPGGLLAVQSAARPSGSLLCVDREAPAVTSGGHADGYLMTLRESPDARPDQGLLLYAGRGQVAVQVTRPWQALGMRATQSVGLRLTGCVPAGQAFGAGRFRDVVLLTLVPVAHLGWSAAWLGAAGGVVRQTARLLRRRAGGSAATALGDLALVRLARARLGLDAAGSLLHAVTAAYQRAAGSSPFDADAVTSTGFQIRLNGLKVLASEASQAAVADAMDLLGLSDGYLVNDRVPLERVHRDLRAAGLMYSNDRLLKANGTLALLDTSLGAELAE